jgi:hypothetical protein
METALIIGVSQRSGTNFLHNLLLLHPACGSPREPVREDCLLKFSGLPIGYVDALVKEWSVWGDADYLRPPEILVSKMPSSKNIRSVFDFFPGAKVVVLLRDGRATCESRVRSFGETYEVAMQRWGEGADEIIDFIRACDSNALMAMRVKVVRYEDLVTQPRTNLADILNFLGLDQLLYPFEEAMKLPVFGSSTYGRDQQHGLNWGATERHESFDPLNRWKDWPRRRHQRFNWVCGARMKDLGYEALEAFDASARIRNTIRDEFLQALLRLRESASLCKQGIRCIFGKTPQQLAASQGMPAFELAKQVINRGS